VRSRSVAAITALWLVVCGVLAMRHEASTAHVLDRTGAFVHARELAHRHTGPVSDIHAQRDVDVDSEHCALLTGFHQAASADVARPTVACAALAIEAVRLLPAPRAAARVDVYRLAPKTSPPVAG
jgi:hypothetical protein